MYIWGGTSASPIVEAKDFDNGTYYISGSCEGVNNEDVFRITGDAVKFTGTGDTLIHVWHDDDTSQSAGITVANGGDLFFNMQNHDLTISTSSLGLSTEQNAGFAISNIKNFNVNVRAGEYGVLLDQEESLVNIYVNEDLNMSGDAKSLIMTENGGQFFLAAGNDANFHNQDHKVMNAFNGGEIWIEAGGDITVKNDNYAGIEARDADSYIMLNSVDGKIAIETANVAVGAANEGRIDITAKSIELGSTGTVALAVMHGGSVDFNGRTSINDINDTADNVRAVRVEGSGSKFEADELHINAGGTGAEVMGAAFINAQVTVNNDAYITASSSLTSGGPITNVGIYACDDVTAGATVANFKGKTFIDLKAAQNDDLNAVSRGIWLTKVNSSQIGGPSLSFADDVVISTSDSKARNVYGIYKDHGNVVIDKGFIMNDSTQDIDKVYAIMADGVGVVQVNTSGVGMVQLRGNLMSNNGAMTEIHFDQPGSYLTGSSYMSNGGVIALHFKDQGLWNVTGDSIVRTLYNEQNSVIDMTQGADSLLIIDYSGIGGNFIMDTDLASETDGDKVVITNAAAGTTYVQVKDASLTNGSVVTGPKNLLLITDASKNAAFAGKNLNAGGLWDVTPTIENGLKVTLNDGTQGTEDQWYLTKIEKTVNNDTGVLLDAADNSYALWRNSNDTLRKRLGELRYRANKNDGDGIWARYIGGKFGSSGFDGSYNMYQLGYDKADNAKSTYGFAVESGTGHADYSLGSGKDKLWAGSLYGTWQGEHGNYTDVVAKIGQFDTDINSYGDYPDKASSKNHAYSLSVEYGKTIELSEAHGTFIEPQVQFIMGRLGSSSYTTDRGNNVYLSGVNSYIGRLGIVAGQKMSDGNDIYLKANLLHEFGGDRDIYMQAANGETLSDSRDYGDTWFALGLGGNVKLSNNSHFYGDIERSFGAEIQKKWQINAGVRWTF